MAAAVAACALGGGGGGSPLSRTMVGTRSPALAALLAALLVAPLVAPALLTRHRRQLADDDALQPLEDASGAEQAREKRKLEGVTQAKFGIKNAVLGFVFGKINSLIDAKTRLVESLDKQNIELNKQYGIEAPSSDGLASLSGILGQVIGPKLQLLGPKIQAVSGLLGGASGGGGSGGSGGSGGGGLGSILSLVTSLSGSSSGGGGSGGATIETIDSDEDDS